MPKEKKYSQEELERRRIARREKYKQIKSDPEKYALERSKKREAYLKRKNNKKIKTIAQMSPREQRLQRKKWRENSIRYYTKKSNLRKIQEVAVSQTSEINTNTENCDPLQIKQNIEKKSKTENSWMRKFKALKLKYVKEKKEMLNLIKKYRYRCRVLTKKLNFFNQTERNQFGPEIEQSSVKHVLTPSNVKNNTSKVVLKSDVKTNIRYLKKKISQGVTNIQDLVKIFYENDINSRNTAGKKEYVKKHGVKKQKRYLLDSIKNLHIKFLEENPNIRVSYVTFSRLRPFWVYLPRDDRDTCACLVHTNIDLMIAALKKRKIIDISNYQSLLDLVCCDKYNIKCVDRKCEICKNKTLGYKEFDNLVGIEYQEWCRDKKKIGGEKEINIIKKFTKQAAPRNLILKIEEALPKFFAHTVNIINQYQTVTQLKESLNDYEALVHMDFSENYCYKYAEEVQSLHFGGSRGQVSLHTIVIYIKNGRETVNYSLCTVSECTRHDSAAVWAHLQTALEFLFEKSSSITTLHILTDGPTSQYRNKQIFYIMTQLRETFPSLKSVTWNYQEAGHGKGAPDGIGAVVKRTADYQVKCGRDVGDFSAFVEIVRNHLQTVEIRVVHEYEILSKDILLPKDIATFKGTMLVHQVLWNAESEFLEFRKLSCFKCINKICEHEDKHMQLHKIYKSTIEPTVANIRVLPESKKITILSDISFKYINEQGTSSTSRAPQAHIQNVKSLAQIKESWENQTFVLSHADGLRVKSGHEQEFISFLNQRDLENNKIEQKPTND